MSTRNVTTFTEIETVLEAYMGGAITEEEYRAALEAVKKTPLNLDEKEKKEEDDDWSFDPDLLFFDDLEEDEEFEETEIEKNMKAMIAFLEAKIEEAQRIINDWSNRTYKKTQRGISIIDRNNLDNETSYSYTYINNRRRDQIVKANMEMIEEYKIYITEMNETSYKALCNSYKDFQLPNTK